MTEPLVNIVGVHKSYDKGRRKVLRGVDLQIEVGHALGLTGPSGVGKSTLANLLLGMDQPDSGAVMVDGQKTSGLAKYARRNMLRKVQIIWQDPRTRLNPFMEVVRQVAEPLIAFRLCSAKHALKKAGELLAAVGLEAEFAKRRPGELSGGQCQRVAIARALALEPKLLICDEAMASLDPVGKKQICVLLDDLRREKGIALLVISHDLGVIGNICSETAVMVSGRLAAHGTTREVFDNHNHSFIRALAAAQPKLP